MKCVVVKDDGVVEHRLVYGEVYAPNRPDADGEYMTAEHILKMAHDFVRQQRMGQIDTQHDNVLVEGATVVESFIARKDDPDFIEGAWVVGVHIPDDKTWAAVKSGEINGFSMEAMVTREDRNVELEMPPIVSGSTSTSENHSHTFYVSYGPNWEFMGGKTDEVDAHSHVIKFGTITEKENGHHHSFSAVDDIEIIFETLLGG
jgi:hypothetical protein